MIKKYEDIGAVTKARISERARESICRIMSENDGLESLAAKNVPLIMGQIYFAQKRFSDAKQQFQSALSHDPNNPGLLVRLAQTYAHIESANGYSLDGITQIKELLEQALSLSQNNLEAFDLLFELNYNAGLFYKINNQPMLARHYLLSALKLVERYTPDDAILIGMARVHCLLGNKKEALRIINKMIK